MKEQWVTQDDTRVCPICQPLDGKIFEHGEGPVPPLHEHCRCVRIPIENPGPEPT